MKKLVALVLALLTACACVAPALADSYYLETGDEMVVGNCRTAPLYASYERGGGRILTLYTCVAYDNYLGYMDEDYLSKLPRYSSKYFRFPTGGKSSSGDSTWDPPASSGENAFTYSGKSADPNQKISPVLST